MLIRVLVSLLFCLPAVAQRTKKEPAPGAEPSTVRFAKFPVPDAKPLDVADASKQAVAAILLLQEGEGGDQWPYEGVYREDRGQLPVGYRVGGTAITCMGLLAAPGYRSDEARQQAVKRGTEFVLETLDHKRMEIDFIGTYDVRGWGHIYALQFFLHLQDAQLVPKDCTTRVADKVTWLVKALVESAIPERGGWNYSRRAGYLDPKNAASTFMTAPALQALFHAKARGHAVPNRVVEQALDALERARALPGGYSYGAPGQSQADVDVDAPKASIMNRTPGSAARATACETTLMLAGRGDAKRLERALDLFFDNWDELAKRKSQLGTHIEPYGIAPYYFMYGHVYCAQAIQQLEDPAKKEKLHRKLLAVLARSRDANGSWNDRQFGRSAGYGTAFALMTMHMPRMPPPQAWQPDPASK